MEKNMETTIGMIFQALHNVLTWYAPCSWD